ncbi:MAG: ABC transporter ATP-binding protein [Acidimicrobiia bacterium]|nr:ABC transporter ATP-binding protein [Acidimicrobiia bacterium]MDQ3500339.1 ABC transporter ATP-binding protein [Actinomycetota bacterium]
MGDINEGTVSEAERSETESPVVIDHSQPRAVNPEVDPIAPLGMEVLDEAAAFPAGETESVAGDVVTTIDERPQETVTPTDSAVWARGLSKEFEPGVGVFDLDLDIPKGSIFGFIGPSGSGKTSTIRLLTGIIAADSGDLLVLGKSPLEFDRIARSYLGYMPQLSVLYPELTLRQNLNFAASLFSVRWRGRRRRVREMLDFVDLLSARNRLLRNASGGMQRRLALAATLIHEPELLFLDEPTAGIDPVLRRKFWDRFIDLKEQGRTIFVTTQYVGEAAYCDKVGVLSRGRLIAIDTPEGLRRQAMGGEVLDVRFESALTSEQISRLVEAARATRWEARGPGEYRLVVEDAGDVAADLSEWATANSLVVESVEPYQPPFDDVFVELVTRLDVEEESDG